MSAAQAGPGYLPAPGTEDTPPPGDPGLPGDPWLAEEPWLAEDPWLDQDSGPLPEWLDDPEWDTPGRVAAWLDRELARAAPWLDGDPEWAEPAPGPREVLKAGRWDRSRGDGGGFAAGGVGDRLPPGPVLAGLAGDRWAAGLGRLSDDELIGILRAARRLASWAAAMELAAVADLWRRRTAEEAAGDTGAAVHADGELAAALTLTRHAADKLLGLAVGLERLPDAAAALAAGDIDLPRAQVIADEVAGLSDKHAAAVDRAITSAAPAQTTGQLRVTTRTAVLAADPSAARNRKEQAEREARVERWTEPAGTAALVGRDLPPAQVLAADANLTALATQLKAAGAEGTMDALRARIYLALLTGTPAAALLPTDGGRAADGDTPTDGVSPGDSSWPTDGSTPTPNRSPANSGKPTDQSSPSDSNRPTDGAWAGMAKAAGRINLTLPLATWLGQSETPGHVAGYGPLDATDSRALAHVLATRANTKWCLTFVSPDGRPVAHGCAHGRPPDRPPRASRRRPLAGSRDGPGDRPEAGPRDGPDGGSRDGPEAGSRDGPDRGTQPQAWSFTMTLLADSGCDHAWVTPAYRPSAALRHLVDIRHTTCVFPGCRRPTAQCDADHTLAYDHGGRTCLCNLAPLCRHHHRCKQSKGWQLEQAEPGVLVWRTPAGRTYTTTPAEYPV